MSAASFDALGMDRVLGSVAYRPEDFPGCESFHLPASELDQYEGRLEFWDSVTETAWKVCEPTSIQHEQPSRQLAQIAGQFAMVRAPGLAIHVRRGTGYREEGESRAFPGWKTEEIHRALTEDPMSQTAWRGLERTALAMGAREGTKPEHNPLTHSLSARARAQGHREGRAQGHREGHARGRMAIVAAALRARGIEAALDFTEDRDLFSGLSRDALMAAALACTGEADFRRRVREQLALHRRNGVSVPYRQGTP